MFQNMKFNDFDDGATSWLRHLLYIYIYIFISDYDMDFELMVMLRSTTGRYGRSVIDVAYGEMILSLHRDCMRDDSLERVVRVLA